MVVKQKSSRVVLAHRAIEVEIKDIFMATGKEEHYPIDPENAVEMSRLLNQDTMITKAMGGPLSEQGENAFFHNVLDLACGPGGWVLDVARMLPEANVTGTDISTRMTNYGRATANARGLHNAHFTTMSIQEPFPFADNSFDLVNARYLVAVLTPKLWPTMLRETFRVCQSGGIIRLTEPEMPITNSPAFEKITQMGLDAFSKTGRNFGPTPRNFGITPMMSRCSRMQAIPMCNIKLTVLIPRLVQRGMKAFIKTTQLSSS